MENKFKAVAYCQALADTTCCETWVRVNVCVEGSYSDRDGQEWTAFARYRSAGGASRQAYRSGLSPASALSSLSRALQGGRRPAFG